jgi:diacylglycerol kinase (ATP)
MLPSRRPSEMPRFTRAALIFNPAARRMQAERGRLLQRVLSGLTTEGLQVQVTPTSGPGDATRLAREAVAARCDVLVACGGDGTVNEVVGGLAGSDVPLLVIPGGTSNVLAREIGLSRDLLAGAGLLHKGAIRRISLGRAGDRRFVLMAGIGVDAGIVAASDSRIKRFLGEGAFWLAGFQQLAKYHFSPFDLVVDGKSYRGTFALISKVKNYGGPFQLTPQANLFSNQFAICLFQSEVRWRYLHYLSRVARGKHMSLPDVLMLKGRTIEAAGSTKIHVQVDGELLGTLPQTISIQDNALSLIVPRARSTDL